MQAKILNASAGSGKTYRLAYNYVRDVIWQPMLYRHILAVTFTNKATEEMKSRILKEIHLLAADQESDYLKPLSLELALGEQEIRQRARKVQSAILHDYSHFTVLTIDKFFQRILHAFLQELGIDLNYTVELESAPILARSVDALIERIAEDQGLKQWLEAFARERIEEHEGWDLRRDILKLGGELFKEGNRSALASARSKEELEAIVRKATAKMEQTLNHFKSIGNQAVERIAAAGLTITDFSYGHSGGVQFFYTAAAGEITEPKARARKCASTTEGWMTKGKAHTHEALIRELQPLMAELCAYYDQHISHWHTTRLIREHYRTFALMADLYSEVQRLWQEENSMLLSETKNILSSLIGQNKSPFIYEKVGNRYDRYFIDEFQDTSEREWLNFLPLLEDALAHKSQLTPDDHDEPGYPVLLVGDIKQSIYRWRGGDWRILGEKASAALPGADVEQMQYNFRSQRNVVAFNNAVMERVVTALDHQLATKLKEAGVRADLQNELSGTLSRAYEGHRQIARKKSRQEGCILVETYKQEPPLVERVCELLDRGFRPSEIMILGRSRNDGARAARTLLDFKRTNRDERYRFDVMTQDALRMDASPLCQFIIALLQLTVDPEDSIRRAICNRYLKNPFDQPLSESFRELLGQWRLLAPEEAFSRIVEHFNLTNERQQIAYLQALHEQIIHFSSGRVVDIPLFLNWWEEKGKKRSLMIEESEETIEITTIHTAKGLEKKVIILPYCSWSLEPKASGEVPNILWAEAQGPLGQAGSLPVRYKSEMATSEFSEAYYRELVYSYVDNVNLLYVALTRAVEQLHIFIPTTRQGIGAYLWEGIERTDEECRIEGLTGKYTRHDQGERCCFGDFLGPEPLDPTQEKPTHEVEHRTLTCYPSVRPTPEQKYPHTSYREHGGEAEFSPRNFGILMHRLFAEATNRQELQEALKRLEEEALLSPAESLELNRQIAQALENPQAASWYDGSWDRVLRERDIIRPKSTEGKVEVKRPDRVMIKGKHAVVVDYKFGRMQYAENRNQIREYMELLRKMGYQKVEGWLWYVRQGETEEVI